MVKLAPFHATRQRFACSITAGTRKKRRENGGKRAGCAGNCAGAGFCAPEESAFALGYIPLVQLI